MAELIKQDTDFTKEILTSGGENLMKCYQCGTCTVVCNPTPEEKPFPRKEMLYAQWGMKDKLLRDTRTYGSATSAVTAPSTAQERQGPVRSLEP